METTDRNHHGAIETNGLVNPNSYHDVKRPRVTLHQLAAKNGYISRLRYFAEKLAPGAWVYDVSYIHAVLPDGSEVEVINGPLGEVRGYNQFKAVLVDWAKQESVYAKGVGLLDKTNWSTVN